MTGPGQAPGAISSNGRALRDPIQAAALKGQSGVQIQMPWILPTSPKEPSSAPNQPPGPSPSLMPVARMALLRLRLILGAYQARICMAALQVMVYTGVDIML